MKTKGFILNVREILETAMKPASPLYEHGPYV